MKKSSLFAGFILFSFLLQAQDTLVLRDNRREVCTVQKVRLTEIEYLPWGKGNTAPYAINKSLVQYIIYNTGTIDTLNPLTVEQANASSPDTSEKQAEVNYQQGFKEGYQHTQAGPVVAAGIASGCLTPYGGIAVPIILSLSKVKGTKISDPAYTQSKSPAYKEGYLKGAGRKRRTAIWSGYGGTVGVIAGAIILLTL
ncbi:MAG: hypothetical protein JNL57_06980 [Bacteroidetes bacterium]|nr:hypothetical protein [Bacteroidota bacterium]